jgi:hypothetical protein
MIKYKIYFTLPALLLIFSCNVFSQTGVNFLDSLSDKFLRYCKSYPWEEIYVHTDRDVYISGENMWFNIYLFDRQSSELSSESKIACFEILNAENKPVVQKRIRLYNGVGSGQTVIPDTLSSGLYNLRVYTNRMKNFMPVNCFSMSLKIYNVLKNNRFIVPVISSDKIIYPDSSSKEINIKTNRDNPDVFQIEINSTQDYLTENNSIYYLFIQTHGIINFKSKINLTGETDRVDVPARSIIPGINHITIFNALGKPVCEHFSYTPRNKQDILTITSPDVVKARDKITIEAEVEENSLPGSDTAYLSLSVVPSGMRSFPDIADYMVFGSEFGELPDVILKQELKDIPPDLLDKFLLTTRSNWIDWNNILSDNHPFLKYKKESGYHYLYGHLVNKLDPISEANHVVFLSVPGKNATFQYSGTDSYGSFSFSLPIDEKLRDLIIQPSPDGRDNSIFVESGFSVKYPDITGYKWLEPVLPQEFSKPGINYRVMKIFNSDEIVTPKESMVFTSGLKRFYGKPDLEVLMSNYVALPTMQEVFFELLPGVSLTDKNRGNKITIKGSMQNRVYDEPPLLLIDGVVIKDPSVAAKLDPLLVEKIDVIKSGYIVGDCLFYGLVNIITKAGNLSNVTLPDHASRLQYRAYEPSKSFSSPGYSLKENKQNHAPDFRNTLYWNPSITLMNGRTRIEFWASDYLSDYEIILQGVTKRGDFISQKKLIKVLK